MNMSVKAPAQRMVFGAKAKATAKSALTAVKNIRLGPATGSYRSNTLGQTASLMKQTVNKAMKK